MKRAFPEAMIDGTLFNIPVYDGLPAQENHHIFTPQLSVRRPYL